MRHLHTKIIAFHPFTDDSPAGFLLDMLKDPKYERKMKQGLRPLQQAIKSYDRSPSLTRWMQCAKDFLRNSGSLMPVCYIEIPSHVAALPEGSEGSCWVSKEWQAVRAAILEAFEQQPDSIALTYDELVYIALRTNFLGEKPGPIYGLLVLRQEDINAAIFLFVSEFGRRLAALAERTR
jgi:hypothetical protein